MSQVIIDMPALIAEFNRQGGPALIEKAQQGVANTKRDGPRDPAHKRHIIDQYAVGTPRVVSRVIAVSITTTSSFWHWLEFGTSKQAPSRPLTRGMQAAGLKVLG